MKSLSDKSNEKRIYWNSVRLYDTLNYFTARKLGAKCVKLVVAELWVVILSGTTILCWLRKCLMLYSYCCQKNQFSSVAQSCPTLCDPMNRSTPGLPVHHKLPEFTQTHMHRVSNAIQPSHPLSSPSPPALNPSQHQSLFQWVTFEASLCKYSLILPF